MTIKINGVEIYDANEGNYIEDIGDDDGENMIVETEGGNYTERIEGNFVQGRGQGFYGAGKTHTNPVSPKTDVDQPKPAGVLDVVNRPDRIIYMGGGNYNRHIGGDYIQGDVIG